jgi:molybdopterin-containing oxidoreductase family membrane subunit
MGAVHRRAWALLVLFCVVVIAFGVYCYTRQTEEGFIATNLRNPGAGGAAWGLYIAFDVIFVGVSFAGITVAAIARLFDVDAIKPVTRLAELLTITALLSGGCVVMSDLGRPGVGLMNLPKFANPTSPFFGTFTLVVAGYLFSSLVYFFLSGRADAAHLAEDSSRPFHLFYKLWASGYKGTPNEDKRHQRVSFILAISILPLLVTAHSTLGFIFGIQVGRPGWFSALQAPGFVVMAGVSGTGILILLVVLLRWMFALPIPDKSIRWLGDFMWVLAVVYLYFIVVDELTSSYASPAADRHVAHELTHGRFGVLFFLMAGSLLLSALIPLLLFIGRRLHTPYAAYFVRGQTAVRLVALSAFLANVAAFVKRFLIVVPSQLEGALTPVEKSSYSPALIEFGVVAGLMALTLFMILVFARIFPLVPTPHTIEGEPAPDRPRFIATVLWALFAIALIVLGLADSFRLLRPSEIDPTIPFAPVIFAVGVMALFSSAIVYEVFPRDVQEMQEGADGAAEGARDG